MCIPNLVISPNTLAVELIGFEVVMFLCVWYVPFSTIILHLYNEKTFNH